MSKAKRTAHRPSQSNRKYVKNSRGEQVLNTAYVQQSARDKSVNNDISSMKSDFSSRDSRIRSWSKYDGEYETNKIYKIEDTISGLDSLISRLEGELRDITSKKVLSSGSRKYHEIVCSDPHKVITVTIRGERPSINDGYYSHVVRYREDPELVINRDNLKKAFYLEDASDEIIDALEEKISDSYILKHVVSGDYYGDHMSIYWESTDSYLKADDILLNYLREKYDPDLDMIWDINTDYDK